MTRATWQHGCLLLGALCLIVPPLRGQHDAKITYPDGTLFLELDAKGIVRIAGQKAPLKTAEEVKKYLVNERAAAAKKAQSGKDKGARPLVMFRVREELPDASVEKLRKVARAEGYRTGLDLYVLKKVASTTSATAPAGAVVVDILKDGSFEVLGRKGAIKSIDDLLKALKEVQPAALKAARKARGEKARPHIVVRVSKEAGGPAKALPVMVKVARVEGYGSALLSTASVETTSVEKKLEIDK